MVRRLQYLVVAAILPCAAILPLSAAEPPPPISMALWPGEPPNPIANPGAERDDGTGRIWNVSVPGMLVYLPARDASFGHRTAIIECPGGGYTHLTRLAGADGAVAAFLPHDMVVISLKYRLSPPSAHVERDALADGQRAIRLVRSHAAEWGIDPHHVGVMGASAGANLVLNLASHVADEKPDAADAVDHESARPDFVVLLSPWPHGHPIRDYPIGKDAPPAMICSARDDKTAPVTFAEAIAAEYQKAGVPAKLVLVDKGGHGAFTIGAPGEGGKWPETFWPWLEHLGMYTR